MFEDDYLTVPQAAKLLKITPAAVRKRIRSKTLFAKKIGRDYFIPKNQTDPLRKPLTEEDRQRIEKLVKKSLQLPDDRNDRPNYLKKILKNSDSNSVCYTTATSRTR